MAEDFDVLIGPTKIDEDTVLISSTASWEELNDAERKLELAMIRNYNGRKIDTSSAILNDTANKDKLTLELVDELALGINSSLPKVQRANAIIRQQVHSNGIFGRFYEIMRENIPRTYKLSWGELEQDESRADQLKDVKFLINSFNRDVGIEDIIQEAISGTILEGNYSLYLRMTSGNSATIDHYPLDICRPSGYKTRGNDILQFDISALKAKLQKVYPKTRKNKKIYYESMKPEIKANYPVEVYTAYNARENICRLSTKYSGMLRLNDLGRLYGVSALFKGLKPLIILMNLQAADVSDSRARARKIIFQKLRKEVLEGGKKGLVDTQHAHSEAAKALQTTSCLYTGTPAVEDLSYVTPKTTETDYKALYEMYTGDLLRALGLPFLDSGSTTSVAKTNVSLLLRMINSIALDLDRVIEHFYEALLEDNGYDLDLCPKFRIDDAESNDMNVRQELAIFLYNTLGCSFETAYGLVGLDVKSEAALRQAEDKLGYHEIFTPHATAYTYSPGNDGDNDAGRPADDDSNDEDKQQYDEDYYNEVTE